MSNSSVEHQRTNSISALRRHEQARARAERSKSLPITTIIEIVSEDEAEPILEEVILPPGREHTDLEDDLETEIE